MKTKTKTKPLGPAGFPPGTVIRAKYWNPGNVPECSHVSEYTPESDPLYWTMVIGVFADSVAIMASGAKGYARITFETLAQQYEYCLPEMVELAER